MISVDNDMAFNALIETTGMEQVCLFDTIDDAERTFVGAKGRQQNQKNMKMGYDVTGRSTSTKNGNKFVVPPPGRRGVSLGVDAVQQLEDAMRELSEAKKVAQEAAARERTAKTAAQALNSTMKRAADKLSSIEGGTRTREKEIAKLQAELSELQTEEDVIDTSGWEEEVAKLKDEVREALERVDEARQAKAAAEKVVEDIHAERRQFEATATSLGKQMQKVENELSGMMREHTAMKAAVEKAEGKVAAVQDALVKHESMAEEATQRKEASEEAARKFTIEQMGPDEPLPMPVDGKDSQQIKTRIKLKQESKEKGLKSLPKGQRNLEEVKIPRIMFNA